MLPVVGTALVLLVLHSEGSHAGTSHGHGGNGDQTFPFSNGIDGYGGGNGGSSSEG